MGPQQRHPIYVTKTHIQKKVLANADALCRSLTQLTNELTFRSLASVPSGEELMKSDVHHSGMGSSQTFCAKMRSQAQELSRINHQDGF